MRISTAGMSNQMIGQAMQVQSNFAQATVQQASGLKSPRLSGLGGQAGAAVGLTADISRSKELSTQAKSATAQLEIAYSSVGHIGDLVSGVLVDLAAAIGGGADSASVATGARDALSNAVTLLNTQYAGSYIFSGGASATKPVDIADPSYDPLTNTNYYQAGSNLHTLMLDGGASVDYGVKADDDAFATTLKGLSLLANTTPLDTATMESALSLLQTNVTALGKVQEQLSAQTATINSVLDSQTDFQLYAGEMLTGLTGVDTALASAEAAQQKVLLEASFSALSALKSVSVLNYL